MWTVSGTYIGARDLLVTVQIDSISAGAEIGQATFSWKTSETVTGWEATGVTTSLTALALGADGKKIAWTAGTGADFAEGDNGIFWCYAPFGPGKTLDLDRNSYWQTTGDTSETLVIDFGSPQLITAAITADTNLTPGATISLQGNTSNVWTSPAYSYVLTLGDPASLYLSQTYQYWRWVFADASNPDGFLQIGHIYLGTHVELTSNYARAAWGSAINRKLRIIENEIETGRRSGRLWSVQREFDLVYDVLDATDLAALQSIWEGTHNLATGIMTPIWIHYFQDEASTLMLCNMLSGFPITYRRYGFYATTLKCEEVAKTRL